MHRRVFVNERERARVILCKHSFMVCGVSDKNYVQFEESQFDW